MVIWTIRTVAAVFLWALVVAATAGDLHAGCSVRKGLYDEWVASARRGDTRGGSSAKQQAIGEEYEAFFHCLSESAEALQSLCKDAAADRLASLTCQTVLYVKDGRNSSKQFLDALPAGRRAGELIWDLETVAGLGQAKSGTASLFPPKGPAYKLIEELFVLVLDGKETAAAKYFTIWASASEDGERYMDEQIKMLLREAPAVVVKEWETLRQHQPKLRKLVSDMAAGLPPAELLKMRQGLVGFCAKDNRDCPEILKVFGRP